MLNHAYVEKYKKMDNEQLDMCVAKHLGWDVYHSRTKGFGLVWELDNIERKPPRWSSKLGKAWELVNKPPSETILFNIAWTALPAKEVARLICVSYLAWVDTAKDESP